MPTVEVEFEVYCGECGAGICHLSDGSSGRKGPVVTVTPCDKCMARKYDEGYDKGHDDGRAEAIAELEKE